MFFAGHGFSQVREYSAEVQKRFMSDQDTYLKRLNLSSQQKQIYEEITRRYDKELQKVEWSRLSPAAKKQRSKSLKKSKNAEMKNLLENYQFKMYKKRQAEIENNYQEG